MKETNDYEARQIEEIKKWKSEEPGVLSKVLGTALYPLTWAVNAVIPKAAIRGALDLASSLGDWLADTADIKRDANVHDISDLKTKDLELSDKLANDVHNWAIGIASGEGGVTGFFGIFASAIDIPALITISLRTVHKIGLCYGYETSTQDDRTFVLQILAASGANSIEEKAAAMATLKAIEVTIAKTTWKEMAELAAKKGIQGVSKEAVVILVKGLAKQLGINITKRKALNAIPVIGVLIGAGVNGWFLKDVGWAARRAFEERWLVDNEKVLEIG